MSDQLDDALIAMLAAGREEGITPGSPLDKWQQAVVVLTEAFAGRLTEVVTTAKAAADAECAKAQAAAQEASAAARRADVAVKAMTIQAEQTIIAAVDRLTPAVAEGLSKAAVIREKRLTSGSWLRRVSLGVAGALGLLGTGYGLHAYTARPATELHDRCLRSAVKAADGRLYCPVEALRDAAGSGQGRK